MSRAAREAQAQGAAHAVRHGAPLPRLAAAPALATAPAGGAVPLPAAQRVDMERRFGQDFASVRVARDAAAALAARGFGARAFAHGELIRVAEAGPLEAGLLAHELTHVLQQRALGRAEIACDGRGLRPQVEAWRLEIEQAGSDAAARKSLVAQALGFADTLAAALAAAGQARDDTAADEARDLLQLLIGALARHSEGAAAAAVAGKTPDTAVRTKLLDVLTAYAAASPAGQQALFAQVAPLGNQAIAATRPGQGAGAWLRDNTDAIGKTLLDVDRQGIAGRQRESRSLEMTEGLLKNYFVASKPPADEIPNATGDPAGATLHVDKASGRIKADCDVYATVGARLVRGQGWNTVGYMVIIVHEQDPHDASLPRSGHAVALARKPVDPADPGKGQLYVGIGNTELRELGGHGNAMKADSEAMDPLVGLLFSVYDPAPKKFDIYYAPAGAGGAYDMKLLDPKNAGLTPWRSSGAGGPP